MPRDRVLPIAEDNARFILLGIVLILYMVFGATIFHYLESDLELHRADEFWKQYTSFCAEYIKIHQYVQNINRTETDILLEELEEDESERNNKTMEILRKLDKLLYAYGNASAQGIIYKRRRWDFFGSLHFVGTIVSTIGYGNTAPQTTIGKTVVILYGFLGCSGGILFFNLFLERIITFLAWILRTIHLKRIKKQMESANMVTRRMSHLPRRSLPDILDDDDVSLEVWKPSVYWVMLSLTIASCVIAVCAAAVYSPYENWTYFEAIYFCFVSFATIGFGDYVSTDNQTYPSFYHLVNFVFLVLGCCCIYSLLNVTSIVIKQCLNWIIMRLQCRYDTDRMLRRHSLQLSRKRRRKSSIGLQSVIKRNRKRVSTIQNPNDSNSDDSNGTEKARKLSGELISMKDFLQANKVSLAVMQKQLYETAQMQKGGDFYNNGGRRYLDGEFRPGLVGPLAIVSEKLGDKNSR